MKLAGIALASVLVTAAFVQPGFAQSGNSNDRDQGAQTQYGPGSQNQFRGGMNRDQDTVGQRGNWRRDDDERSAENDDWRGGWRRDGEGMHGHMGMTMGPRLHDRFADERGASFSFGNGGARMSVHCPAKEPVETCVRAASQLLDKIGSLRAGNPAATPGGGSTGSRVDDSGSTGTPSGSSGSGGSGTLQQDEK